MGNRRLMRGMAAITIPLALAVQSVLALGTVPPPEATPEAPERRAEIDPGFIVRHGGNVDPGFIADFEDRSNDIGFIVGSGTLEPAPAPFPTPAPATPGVPVITRGTP